VSTELTKKDKTQPSAGPTGHPKGVWLNLPLIISAFVSNYILIFRAIVSTIFIIIAVARRSSRTRAGL